MDHRIGICSACGAHYKIPASFIPNQARCRACSGVVHIRPPNGEARSRAPQRDTSTGREPRAPAIGAATAPVASEVAAGAASASPSTPFAPGSEPARETSDRDPAAQPRVERELATQRGGELATQRGNELAAQRRSEVATQPGSDVATQSLGELTPAPPSRSQAPRGSAARRVVWAALILAVFVGLWIWWMNRASAPIQARSASSPGGNGAASVHEDASRAGGEPSAGH
jgi:hypothetical protein